MERTLEQTRQILSALSNRNPEAGLSGAVLETLAREFHEDLGNISAEATEKAYREIRRNFRRFPKFADFFEIAKSYQDQEASSAMAITEGPSYKSDYDIEKSKKKLEILGKVAGGVISYELGIEQIEKINSREG